MSVSATMPSPVRAPDVLTVSDRVACMPARVEGHCVCGSPLPAGKDGICSPRRRWCGKTCAEAATLRHYWPRARAAALTRNRRAGGLCEHCGAPDPGKRPDGKRYRYRSHFEVNHIQPLIGAYRGWSCLNHQDNLEALCHACHVQVTNQQRASRRVAAG